MEHDLGRLHNNTVISTLKFYGWHKFCGEFQREKFIKSIILDDQQVNNNRIVVPIRDEEIDDSIMELPKLDVNDIDDKSDNRDDDEIDEFIKL
ncbi:hypothetical protein C1646_750819 [Rhizophagus diaphanus]|nr:hypothetical protein C1646_750819 [Rhizophagus diaphanus] [Rhizophagus sp. MUCL 43196]